MDADQEPRERVAIGEISVEQFAVAALDWLDSHASRRRHGSQAGREPGLTAEGLAVFADPTPQLARAEVAAALAWQRAKWDAGYAGISWPVDLGGAGLSTAHERVFARLERDFETPASTEAFNVTLGMVAPTIRHFGSEDLKRRFLPAFLRGDDLCCQLFSEPDAGSDLASLTAAAVRDGDKWRISGQKSWCSGAPFCSWGEALVRTGSGSDRHDGLTVFMVPMTATGVEVRPIVQMTGGASFHQVFLDGVVVGDDLRLGSLGDGWRVAQATLGYERGGGAKLGGGNYRDVIALAKGMGLADNPLVRQELASLYIEHRVNAWLLSQPGRKSVIPVAARASMGKLAFTNRLTRVGEVAAGLLGSRIAADTGELGTYAWAAHLLGAPGTRIAGGSDEIQRNVIAERGLGLPR